MSDLFRLWLKRWAPAFGLIAVAMVAALAIFGTGDGEPSDLTRKAVPWQASVPLIFGIFGVMAWIDWGSMKRHPEDPKKWFANRGRG
ncbi:hypothetical protein [Pseudooceanicola sp. MF1-13]|uniref:hypothetical protein n=1 Tax=Pseudooceanicola sp. MF1-13 TaxID=3379095 RepID=UPI003892B28C